MNVGIVGAGSLGTLFGVALARGGANVRMLVRRSETLAAIVARGGVLVEGRPVTPVFATLDPAALIGVDIVLVAVKAPDTVAALAPLRAIVPRDVVVVSIQNGLDAVVAIERALGARASLALAPTTEGALQLDPSSVRHAGRGTTKLGWAARRNGGDALASFAATLRAGDLDASVVAPIEPFVWAKAVANAAINPVTALAGVANGELLDRPDLRIRWTALAREAASVAAAAGIALPFDDAAVHVASVLRSTAANRSSMLRDLERGRETEIEAICGALVREARRLDIEVPHIAHALDEVRARTKA